MIHVLTEYIAAMGGTYEFAKIASANLREKDDSWNTAIGGFLAGSVMGLKCWSFAGGVMLFRPDSFSPNDPCGTGLWSWTLTIAWCI